MPDAPLESPAGIDALIAQYLKLVDCGGAPGPDEFIQAHPEHEEALRRYFENLSVFEDLRAASAADASTLTPPRDPEIPPRFGHYQIDRVIGRGAMGTVYAAYDSRLDRHVALKIPRPSAAMGDVEKRFFREARSAARLNHPNICPVYEVGDVAGQHYISMAWIRGFTLKDFARSQVSQPEGYVALLIRKLALAIAEAHRNGILHRDLKSANVMVDESGEPIVMDFGLASLVEDDADVTQTGTILGTPAYMAPEQVEGNHEQIGPATDVYGLGVVLYELLTGRLPFKGRIHAVLKQIPVDDPPPPSQFRPGLDRNLEAICLKMLAKPPEDRYATMDEVAEDLHRYRINEPTHARPIGRSELVWRWLKRHPVIGVSTAVVAACSIIAVALTVVAVRAHNSAAVAQAEADQQSAHVLYTRASAAGEQHGDSMAMLRFADALRFAVQLGDTHLESSIRRQLGAWQQNLCTLETAYFDESHIFAVAVSPDGRFLVTGSSAQSAKVWDAQTGELLREPLPHEGTVYSVAISPDGTQIATASGDHTAQIWDFETGRRLGPPLMHHHRVLAVTFSPDGRLVLTGSHDTTAQLWDAESCEPVGPPMQHPDLVRSVAFSPDGDWILTGCEDGRARLWLTATSQPAGREFHDGEAVFSAAFSPDADSVVTGGKMTSAQQWDVATGERIGPPLQHLGWVMASRFAPDGETIVTAGLDNTLRLWSVPNGLLRGRLDQFDELRAATFSPDGDYVVTGSWDGVARRWKVPRPLRLQHSRPLRTVHIPSDHQSLLTIGARSIDRWDATSGTHTETLHESPDWIPRAAVSPDGSTAMLCKYETAELIELSSGRVISSEIKHAGVIRDCRFSPNGALIATASHDGTARLWSAKTGLPVGLPLEHPETVMSLAFSPDGQMLLTASADRTAQQWSVATCERQGPSVAHDDTVYAVTYHPDGTVFATSSLDRTVRLWDAATCLPTGLEIDAPGIVRCLTFSVDGQVLITGSDDGVLSLWDVMNGERLGPDLHLSSRVESVTVSPDGDHLVSRCQDGTIWLHLLYEPVNGSPDDVLLWVQVITGMELDQSGASRVLNRTEWEERWLRLQNDSGEQRQSPAIDASP